MKKITQILKFTGMICFLLIAVTIVSCSDDSDEDNNTSGNSKIVGVWKKTKEETRMGTEAWEDVTEDCDLDDTEEYVSDGDWALYPGTVTCNGSANVINGSWELRANGTKVVYTYDGFQDEFESNVVELTDTKMVLTHSAGDVDNTQYRDTYSKE